MSAPEGGWPTHWPPDAIAFIREMLARLEKLEAENAALRKALEELQRSAHRQAGPFRRRNKVKKPKQPGRKKGPDHGATSNRPPPDQVDETVEVPRSECCPECGGGIDWEKMTASQFQTDIPPVRPHTVKFKIPVGHCCRCKMRIQPRHPRQTSDALGAAGVQIGPNALGMAVQMNKVLGVPFAKVSSYFGEAFQLRVATSTLVRAMMRGATELDPVYRGLATAIRENSVVHMDETGWRIKGTSCWLWVFVAKDTTFFVVGGRGSEVPLEILGEDWTGTMAHDGLGVYDVEGFDQACHQTCNFHLLHRSKKLEELVPGRAKQFPKEIAAILKTGFALRDRRDAGEIEGKELSRVRTLIEGKLDRALDRRIEQVDTARFKRHLEAHRDQILHYLYDPEVAPTNNAAERAIRPAVIVRKRGGCSRSDLGARAHAVWVSLGCTAAQRGVTALETFVEVFRRSWSGVTGLFGMPGGP